MNKGAELAVSPNAAARPPWWLITCSITVAAVATIAGAVLLAGAFRPDAALAGSVIYAFVSVGAGLVLTISALGRCGRARTAWLLIGLGVLCWGIGEAVWLAQSLNTGEIPYPGPADFFYVLGYPLILTGVVFLPYMRPGRYERLRLGIDAAAGALSLGVVMWVAYLNDVVSFGGGQAGAELMLNLFYPFGDVLLATALMILAMRRSEQRIDIRIFLLAAGVALTTIADVIFSVQAAADAYVEWGWLDGVWLFSYAAFALTAWALARPYEQSEGSYRSTRGWQLLAPYAAVAALFGIRLATSTGDGLLLNVATTAVAALIVVRQVIAVRERRELLERQRDDLVASVSHELRTPLTSIQGYSQLLSSSWGSFSDQDRQRMVDTIGDEATHLGRIVSDLIDVARDRMQNVKLDRSLQSASTLVEEAAAMGSGDRRVELDLVDGAKVDADPDRIQQVLVNLINNAERYGRSRVKVTTTRDGGQIWFAVHDDGEGVPLKYQADIWERFERGAHRFDATVPGSGIGLSVARDLLAAHGTTIAYRQSDLLGGACFEFPLPEATAPADQLVQA
ncbi:MAG TPA: HAMP domain-containing sensor histidine kinase [Acidimicrobiia bacterium]|jgi:signal transduction histidine kinase